MVKNSARGGRWTRTPKTFVFYGHREAAGAWGDVTTSNDADAQATYAIPVEDGAAQLIEGKLERLHFHFNWANAVTLDKVRLYRHTMPNPFANRVFKIYETPDGVNHADDTEYDYTELGVSFKLNTPETLYASFQWSGAPGNIQGFICVEGERLK